MADAEATASEWETFSDWDVPGAQFVPVPSAAGEGEGDRGGRSQVLVKAETRGANGQGESESEDEESSDESEREGGALAMADQSTSSDFDDSESDSDDSETEEEEVQDDVMFKEQEDGEVPDAATIDDDRDSDFKEEEAEEKEEGDDEETEDEDLMPDEEEGEVEAEPEEKAKMPSGFGRKRAFDPRRKGRDVPPLERSDARRVLQHVQSFVSTQERTAISRGSSVTGPPIHEPLAPIERLARFVQDPAEILEDLEVSVAASQASNTLDRATSAFAAPPRPLMASATSALRQASRKRRRESPSLQPGIEGEGEDSSPQVQALSSDAFVALGRAGSAFSDRYTASLLKASVTELQGVGEQDAYSQRCWTPLPVSRKPVANWRFVFEHLLLHRDARFGESNDAFWPRMSTRTLQRIRDRLKTLFSATWQPADDALFDLMTREGRHMGDDVHEDDAEEDQDGRMVES